MRERINMNRIGIIGYDIAGKGIASPLPNYEYMTR